MQSNHPTRTSPKSLGGLFRSERSRGIFYQVLTALIVVALGYFLISNTMNNLAERNIASGFGYLDQEASFEIGETVIPYEPSDTYAKAVLVGLLNTIKVSLVGILLATVVGFAFGIAQLSPNWLVRVLATSYVETFRNVPILLQLVFWYALITASLPVPRNALNIFDAVFLSNRGIYFPTFEFGVSAAAVTGLLALAFSLAVLGRRMIVSRYGQTRNGHKLLMVYSATALAAGIALVFVGAFPLSWSVPELRGFNFRGGTKVSPEYVAVLLGLTVYTSAYVADIVRSGVLSVSKGQWEAAESLGLNRFWVLRHVIVPQSMRVAIPPLANQYLTLTKNSSLALAVGYPDIVSVSNTILNQTGQAIEAIAIFMAVYLILSLLTSLFMNWFNARMALVER